MEIKGKLIKVLPLETGEGKNGQWQKHDIIVEQAGQYPKLACITLFGAKLSVDGIGLGTEITVSVNVESREHSGKYYTNLNAWKIETRTGNQQTTVDRGYEKEKEPSHYPTDDSDSQLPF